MPDGQSGIPRRVIVKFADNVTGLPYDVTIDSHVAARFPGLFKTLRQRFPGLRVTPLFDSVPTGSIRRFQQGATDAGVVGVPNFLTYFAIRIPGEFAPEHLVDLLRQNSVEETLEAYYVEETSALVEDIPEGQPADATAMVAHLPVGASSDNDPEVNLLQRHLRPGPASVDAFFAWTIKGGDGTGMTFADIEGGWVLDHIEFEGYNLSVLGGGVIKPLGLKHGTNVLGIVAGKKNGKLGQGIAHGLESVLLASPFRQSEGYSVESALMEVLTNPKPPHVILFEVGKDVGQNATLPVETIPCVRQLISIATGRGHRIVVVESAGNAGSDGVPTNVDSVIGGDSGAIIVGAVSPDLGHERLKSSNFGDRVDCYGWGDSIHTATTNNDGSATTLSAHGVGQTSGAAAIIAGVALSIQGMLNSAGRNLLSSPELRSVLRDPALGSTCHPQGTMPDLRKIALHLGLQSGSPNSVLAAHASI